MAPHKIEPSMNLHDRAAEHSAGNKAVGDPTKDGNEHRKRQHLEVKRQLQDDRVLMEIVCVAGSEVEMTVPSMFSMNRAVTMIRTMRSVEHINGSRVRAFMAPDAVTARLSVKAQGHNR